MIISLYYAFTGAMRFEGIRVISRLYIRRFITTFHLPPPASNPFPKQKTGWNVDVSPMKFPSTGEERGRNCSKTSCRQCITTLWLQKDGRYSVRLLRTRKQIIYLIFENRLQQFVCRHMSTILLTYVGNTVDNCQQYCRHMSANKNNKASLKKYHMGGGDSCKRGDG
jgi:hypothetical protein